MAALGPRTHLPPAHWSPPSLLGLWAPPRCQDAGQVCQRGGWMKMPPLSQLWGPQAQGGPGGSALDGGWRADLWVPEDGACAVPTLSGVAGLAPSSSAAQREGRPVIRRRAQAGGQEQGWCLPGSGDAPCVPGATQSPGARAERGRAAGVGRLPRRRWPRECNYAV